MSLEELQAMSDHLGSVDPEIYIRFFEQSPDAIVVVDRTGTIVLTNSQAEFLFGYHRSELVGQPIEVLIPETLRAGHVSHRDNFMKEPRVRPMGLDLPLKARNKTGEEFPVEINLSPIVTKEGTFAIATVRKKR